MAAITDYSIIMIEKGRYYRTINHHRSEVSAYQPVDGQKVGQNDCQVLKACFNCIDHRNLSML